MYTLSRSSFIRFGLLTLFSSFVALKSRRVKAMNEPGLMPSASRLQTLSKGFNLEHWKGHKLTDGYYTQATLHQYKALGLTYTRLPIVLSAFLNDNEPSVLKTEFLPTLDSIIQMHVNAGLGIILSPFHHPYELYSDPAVIAKFVVFFKAFATHLSSTDPERVFLEVMNEPFAENPQIWDNVQSELITALRSGTPNHTIIASSNFRVTANDWTNSRALLITRIVSDKNVV